MNVIGMHNNENTEQHNGYEEVYVLQSSSDFRSKDLREPLLYSYEGLLWIHVLFCSIPFFFVLIFSTISEPMLEVGLKMGWAELTYQVFS